MARLEEQFRLDDPTIRLMMPNWECYSSTGKKIHNWLKKNLNVANTLWKTNLLKIVRQSYAPHCPSCTCDKVHPLPARLLEVEDIQNLRVVKLNKILTQSDDVLRDSLNGLSLHSPPFVQRFSPQEVASSRSSSEDASKASGSGLSRTCLLYTSPSPRD